MLYYLKKIVQQLYLCSNETSPKLYLWSHHLKIITAILKCNRNLLNAKWKVRIPPKLHIFQSLERALCSIVIVNATPEIDRLRVEMVFLFDWQSRSCNIGMRKSQDNTDFFFGKGAVILLLTKIWFSLLDNNLLPPFPSSPCLLNHEMESESEGILLDIWGF